MSYVWEAVHKSVKTICLEDSLRITNIVIAEANGFLNSRRHQGVRDGTAALRSLKDLALSPLSDFSTDPRQWTRIAELAKEAAHLGSTQKECTRGPPPTRMPP